MTGSWDDPRITAWGLLLEAHALVSRRLHHDLDAECSLPATWFEVLLRLGRSPGRQMRMTELAESVSFSSGGFTRLADRLEQAGLLERRPCADDRRGSLATLTAVGAARLDAALAVHLRGLQEYVFNHLDEGQRDCLEGGLRALRAANGGPP